MLEKKIDKAQDQARRALLNKMEPALVHTVFWYLLATYVPKIIRNDIALIKSTTLWDLGNVFRGNFSGDSSTREQSLASPARIQLHA